MINTMLLWPERDELLEYHAIDDLVSPNVVLSLFAPLHIVGVVELGVECGLALLCLPPLKRRSKTVSHHVL